MRVTCPACNAESSLETLLGREADARVLAGFLERNVVFGELLVRYIGLFRPPKRRLGLARTLALVDELLPDIERGAINRKSRDWPAPRDHWREAFETVLAKRDKGTLTLPLTSHGLLLEVLVGIAERYERRDESEREASRRNARPADAAAAPRDLSAVMADVLVGARTTADVQSPAIGPLPAYSGPSRAALEIRQRNEALQRARAEGRVAMADIDGEGAKA